MGNVTKFPGKPDPLAAIRNAEVDFEASILEAVKAAQLAGVPQSMLVGRLYSILNDVEAGIAIFVDDDPEPAA